MGTENEKKMQQGILESFANITITMSCLSTESSPKHKLACMHTIFLYALAHNSAKLNQMAEIKVSMESQDYFSHVWTFSRKRVAILKI